jgi:hypothetical protein
MSSDECACTCVCACDLAGPAARSARGGRDGSSSTSCIMFDRAASTIASESKLGCERTPRDAGDEEKGCMPGTVARPSTSAAADDEIEVDAAAAETKGGSGG